MSVADADAPLTAAAGALLDAQADVLELIARGRPLRDVLTALCRIVEAHAERPVRAAILLMDPSTGQLRTGAAPSLPPSYCAAIDGLAGEVGTCDPAAARKARVITPSLAADPGWSPLVHLPLALGLQAAWSVPILASTGAVLGTFGTYLFAPGEPRRDEIRLVEVLARTAALAIERVQADEAAQTAAQRARFLTELDAATQRLDDPSAVMATTARLLAEHLGVDRCAYAEIDDERTFVITGDFARGVPSIVGRWPMAAFGKPCVDHLMAGKPFVVNDVDTDEQVSSDSLAAYRATGIGAVIAVPLHKGARLTAGMAVHQATPRVWTADEIELVQLVVARCWEALERARVTRELRESEARHRAIVQASPDCVQVVAGDGTVLQMNAAGLRLVAATEEAQIIGRRAAELVAPEDAAAYEAFDAQVRGGQPGTLTFDIVCLDGRRLTIESTAVPLPLAGGGYLAVARDVTARVASERALAENRARLDYAVRLAGVGFWYCDLPFSELQWDRRVKEHFFVPADARVDIDLFYERIHPDDRVTTRTAIDTAIGGHTVYDVVYRTVDPNSGATKWIRALGGAVYGSDGAPVRFDGVTVDVTAQKVAEMRLQQVAEAALTIHAASALESVTRVITEEARKIIGAHQAVTSLTTGDDWAQSINAVSLSNKYARFRTYDVAPNGKGIYAQVCRSNRPMRMTQAELEAHPEWRGFSGEVDRHPPMRGWLAAPLIGRDGRNLGLIQLSDRYDGEFTAADQAILMQLAQIAAVALENVRLYEQLREQDRRKDEFIATLAHELRNPLAPIRTGLHILEITHDERQAAKTRAVMERQLGHLVRMIDDLLDVSRITLGKLTLKKQGIDANAVVQTALETTRPLLEAARHELVLELAHEPLPIEADETRIAQVVANLVNNSVKYTPQGGRIVVRTAREGNQVVIEVRDNGLGIPEDMVTRVFDMFTQVSPSIERSQGGLGLGLTLVRRLVELHDGSVAAHSEGPGQGSTFTVRLPLAARDEAGHPVAAPTPSAGAAPLRVLVVDDNIDGAESLAMLLALKGHDARVAHTGPAALTVAGEFEPQVVFLDIGLPGISGYEVARRLRQSHVTKQPVIVALTGWGAVEDRRQAQAAGFDRHLVKPVDASKVDAVLADVPPS